MFACAAIVALAAAAVAPANAQDGGTRRQQLQAQLTQLEEQIEAQQKILNSKQSERTSLERDVAILTAQITQAKLSIRARDLVIAQLTDSIEEKENKIFGLNSELNSELDSLAGLMRQKNELDTMPLVVAALSSKRLSDFFADLSQFDQINERMQESFADIRETRSATETEKNQLEKEREEETQLRQVQNLQKQQIEQREQEKQRILKDTKGQEKAYQALLAATQKTAAQIRAELFELSGSAAIPFGKALEYALRAEKETGIRPAFLLGIIAEESNLGENVGSGSWRVDMHPTRDRPVFSAVTASLGLNPDTMPVSKKPWYGWGGAMGPAQFIPSTWALYAGYAAPNWEYNQAKDRVGKRTGNTPPNPWNPEDAFMAAALYLTDSGASAQTPSAEFRAAMCYLAGCGNVNNKSLQFYGNDVARLAAKYQKQIDIVGGN